MADVPKGRVHLEIPPIFTTCNLSPLSFNRISFRFLKKSAVGGKINIK